MPDAKALAGVSFARLRASPLARDLWTRAPAQQPELAELMKTTGSDPLRDLEEILIAAPAGSAQQNALLLARGAFPSARWIELAQSRGASMETFQGVPILTSVKDKEPMALALVGESLLIAGDPASVRGAIARRDRPSRLPAEIRSQVVELSSGYEMWFLTLAPIADLRPSAPDPRMAGALEGDLVKAIEQASGGARLGKGLEFVVTTLSRTEQDAAGLANAIRFFTGMAQGRDSGGPSVLQDIRQEGRQLRVSVSIPADQLKRILAVVARGRQPERPQPPPAETGVTIHSSPRDMGVVKIPGPKPQ